MKLHWFVFLALIGMCLTVGAAFVAPTEIVLKDGATEQVVSSSGFEHDRFATMRQGGPGAERHATTLWIGWAFVVFQVLFFGGCLAMGMERRRAGGASLGPAKQPLATILLQAEPETGALYALGTIGGEMYDAYFEKFAFRLALEHRTSDIQRPAGASSVVMDIETYSHTIMQC